MVTNDTTTYEIVAFTRHMDREWGNWSAEGIGSPNEFATIEDATEGIESLIALGDEWRAATYAVREIGESHPEPGSGVEGPDEICAYCERQVARVDEVPGPEDHVAWDEIGTEHAADCEWVITRAFNRH